MPEIDSRNHFYLGRAHDLASGEDSGEPLLYKSSQLTTHAVCVGMTGSGKTGLCLSLLEEAALDGVPAICIDPKGDLGNLMLGFPNLEAGDFEPWVDESIAQRKGISKEELAQQTADMWRKGLAGWDEEPERIQKYNDSVERLIFTPGASHGLPITVLKSFDAPPKALLDDADAFRSRVQSAVSGLLALLGIDADPVQSREHIFLSTVLTKAWNRGRNLSIAQMIREIQEPDFEEVGVMKIEDFYPKKERTKLAMDLNNLLASPSFAGWMTGQPLDVQQLLYSPDGKPRHSILSISHLDDAQRMFFVTILLNEVLAWMRTQPGTGSLRALLYMDEVFGYFPPSKKPPSKEPMLTLLKQARAFGLGVVLATQNPVDLDYKGLSNAGTWFLGRLQTERDKMRVMEGLEGASAQAGSTFDKQKMEQTLAGVGNRVFLMNNVYEDQPQVFRTRWAMSYLAGPLSRGQIKTLMDPVRAEFVVEKPAKAERPKLEPAVWVDPKGPTATEIEEADPPEAAAKVPIDSKRVETARRELSKSESELVASILQLPFAGIEILYRLIDLVIAMVNKKATQRRTSSVFAAAGRAQGKLGRPAKAWTDWRTAYADFAEASGQTPEEATASVPILPMTAWLVVLVEVGVALTLIAVATWLVLRLVNAG
ncbi:AAA-like domain protein [Botrimarina colliarenosi]|uniref:AAA-like domain protein n=1 Tax=Botrimarina colliarenosi TaxID=2528001 RepID=A0A5C6A5R2_9BACT|nr:ATP-binding protein [Botrimarina colliarenosi]TWT94786.1 AAA-like domain protein [Botrimarina colliarenosi]